MVRNATRAVHHAIGESVANACRPKAAAGSADNCARDKDAVTSRRQEGKHMPGDHEILHRRYHPGRNLAP